MVKITEGYHTEEQRSIERITPATLKNENSSTYQPSSVPTGQFIWENKEAIEDSQKNKGDHIYCQQIYPFDFRTIFHPPSIIINEKEHRHDTRERRCKEEEI
ncbi:hypothetical protein DSO57_1013782 [Entomophthora muscae]|uniref:Uncharacterized protein n=1 Tax=Entomophthora muscae TaxID=34485 RepID=A0ACC2S7E3_9FUNG|nr:hypothetical protein DSO57_1013782 [Entomophthora muscae]